MMRFLELYDAVERRAWALHPRLAIVEADHAGRHNLLQALEEALSGRAVSASSVIEVHGVLMEMDGASAKVLAIDGAVNPVVRARDLPGAALPRTARTPGREIEEFQRRLDKAAQDLAEASQRRASLIRQLEEAEHHKAELNRQGAEQQRARESAEAKVEHLHRQQQPLAEAHRLLIAERSRSAMRYETSPADAEAAHVRLVEAEQELAAISERLATSELDYRRLASAHLDPWDGETPPDLAQLRSQLVEADQAVHAAVEALDPASANAEAIDRREVFLRRRAELAADRALLDDSDPTPVIEAVQEFDRATAVPSASDPRALELANKLADLESQRRQLATLVMTSDSSERRARATERLERSRLELAESQRGASRAMLDANVRRDIEKAHEDVLLAQDKAERRLLSGSAKKRLQELRDREHELLQSHGLSSFSDYLLTSSTAGRPDPAAELRFTIAKAELADAERAVASLEHGAGHDPDLQRLEEELAEHNARALAVLGGDPGADLVVALRALRVAVEPTAAVKGVVAALDGIGIAPTNASAVDAARAWLVDREEADRRRSRADEELSRIDAELESWQEPSRPEVDRASLEADLASRQAARDNLTRAIEQTEAFASAQAAIEADRLQHHAALAVALSEVEANRINRNQAEAVVHDAQVAAAEKDAGRAAVEAEQAALSSRAEELTLQANALDVAISEALDALETARVAVEHANHQSEVVDQPFNSLRTDLERASDVEAQARHSFGMVAAEQNRAGPAAVVSAAAPRDVEAIEFYLLSRLASQRSVAFVGSVPLVFDDALSDLDPGDIVLLLDRLDRMTQTIQVVYLTEDAAVLDWARHLRPDQGGVSRPVALA